jgi:hypothetical protein
MQNVVFWDTTTQFVLHRRHITSPLQSSAGYVRFGVLNGSDYEECRLLGYNNPIRTSQETHYVSATEHSRLMVCKI